MIQDIVGGRALIEKLTVFGWSRRGPTRSVVVLSASALAIVSLVQCAVQGGVSKQWKVYRSPDGVFSVEHPSNLSPKTKDNGKGFLVSFQAGGSAAATGAGLLGIDYTHTGQAFAVL